MLLFKRNTYILRRKLLHQKKTITSEEHNCSYFTRYLCISDSKKNVVLLLLDLTAAFDTLCHNQLLKKLQDKFGINGSVLQWFKSYLNDRSFTVTINNAKSQKAFLHIGVPHGSIRGPILFILFTKEIEVIANKHDFSVHLYQEKT